MEGDGLGAEVRVTLSHHLRTKTYSFNMPNILKIASLLLLAVSVSKTNAQLETDAAELCSCSPTVFGFRFDFAATCPGTLEEEDGIEALSCQTLVLGPDQSNTQPVIVDTLTILEVNADAVINSTTLNGPFLDGEEIQYASISSYANLTENYFPFGLEMTLTGENSDGDTVVNIISVAYDVSECDEWPVFPPDSRIGWIDIVSLLFGTVVVTANVFYF